MKHKKYCRAENIHTGKTNENSGLITKWKVPHANRCFIMRFEVKLLINLEIKSSTSRPIEKGLTWNRNELSKISYYCLRRRFVTRERDEQTGRRKLLRMLLKEQWVIILSNIGKILESFLAFENGMSFMCPRWQLALILTVQSQSQSENWN